MSSFANANDAELGANPLPIGGSRDYINPSDRSSTLRPLSMGNNENNEKTRVKIGRTDRRRKRSEELPLWVKSWLSSQKVHQWDDHALPTTSPDGFEETRSSMSSPIGGLAAHDATPKSRHPTSRILSPLALVVLFFLISTGTVISALWTLPLHGAAASGDQGYKSFPKTVADVRSLALSLKAYYSGGPCERLHLLAVLSLTSVWTHAWSIPGSVLLNILTGVLLPPFFATLLQAVLTTLGSLTATILAAPLSPFIARIFPSINTLTRIALDSPPPSYSPKSAAHQTQTSSPWARLATLRLVGIVPWSSINVFSGLARPRISLVQCTAGAFIGVLPWTAVTCQIGDILSSLTAPTQLYSGADGATPSSATVMMAQQTVSSILSSRETMLKLVALTLLSLAPVLAKDKLWAWLSGGAGPRAHNGLARNEQLDDGELEARRDGMTAVPRRRFSLEWWRSGGRTWQAQK